MARTGERMRTKTDNDNIARRSNEGGRMQRSSNAYGEGEGEERGTFFII